MSLPEPLPTLDDLLTNFGQAGQRISELAACEGAAGNMSAFVAWPLDLQATFPKQAEFQLPQAAPALAGGQIIVTGSGRRLRDVKHDPAANLGVVRLGVDGKTAQLFTSQACLFERVTSEFNSHLAVHNDQVGRTGTNFHAVIHAQPPHLTYLSHLKPYQDAQYMNRALMRWQPETIVNLPEGIGVLPFILPGSPQLMAATLEQLQQRRIVLWGKHGIMARSDVSVTRAVDRLDYAEAAAHYEHLNLLCGAQGEGLSRVDLQQVVDAFKVPTTLLDHWEDRP